MLRFAILVNENTTNIYLIDVYYIVYLTQFVLHITFDFQLTYKLFPNHFAHNVLIGDVAQMLSLDNIKYINPVLH